MISENITFLEMIQQKCLEEAEDAYQAIEIAGGFINDPEISKLMEIVASLQREQYTTYSHS